MYMRDGCRDWLACFWNQRFSAPRGRPEPADEQLVAIVQETMQLAQVSLWLRSSSRDEMRSTQV
ncbi:MAG TPA: hypothetical protein VF043_34725 [Ktedonobacteraceae bacterium]